MTTATTFVKHLGGHFKRPFLKMILLVQRWQFYVVTFLGWIFTIKCSVHTFFFLLITGRKLQPIQLEKAFLCTISYFCRHMVAIAKTHRFLPGAILLIGIYWDKEIASRRCAAAYWKCTLQCMILAHNKSYIGKIRHRSTRKKSDSTSSSSLLNAAEPWNGKSGNFNSKETFYLPKSCFFEQTFNGEKRYL